MWGWGVQAKREVGLSVGRCGVDLHSEALSVRSSRASSMAATASGLLLLPLSIPIYPSWRREAEARHLIPPALWVSTLVPLGAAG